MAETTLTTRKRVLAGGVIFLFIITALGLMLWIATEKGLMDL